MTGGPASMVTPPPTGAVPTLLADGLLNERLDLAVPERTRVVMARYEIPPGGVLPWHYHEGRVAGVVTSGTLTRILADGSECVTSAGECIVEPVGPDSMHMAENRGTEPLAICAVFFLPQDRPLATTVPPPDWVHTARTQALAHRPEAPPNPAGGAPPASA